MDKNKLDIEKLLYEQLPKIEEKMLDRLPGNDEIDYKFSQEFESKMNVLIKNIEKSKKKNFYKYLKRIIIVCIVLLADIYYNYYKDRSFSRKFNENNEKNI